jgi:hypothetical protein
VDVLCRQCSPLRASTPVEEHQRGIVPAVGPELLYLLIGAGLAMAAQAIIQLRVVPRVEARKRREDRWERDVLALGELLTAELPDRANAAKSAQQLFQFVAATARQHDMDPNERRAAEERLSWQADEAAERYVALAYTRSSWLAKRVVGIAPQSTEIKRFDTLHLRYQVASVRCTRYALQALDFDEEKYEQEWRLEGQLREQLTAAVETLFGNPPPRNPSRLRQAKRWMARRWKAWKVPNGVGQGDSLTAVTVRPTVPVAGTGSNHP